MPLDPSTPCFDLIDDLDTWGLRVATFRAALNSGIFQALASGKRSAAEVARETGCTLRSARALMDALCPMGFLTKDDAGYGLTPTASAFLVRGRPSFCGDALKTLWGSRDQLVKIARSGKPALSLHTTASQATWAGLAAIELACWEADAPLARRRWAEVGVGRHNFPALRLADLGCGSGLDGFVLAQDDYMARITCVDFSQVLTVASRLADAMQVRQQVNLRSGDLLSVDLPAPFDVVRFGAVLYYFDNRQMRTILAKAHRALVPHGLAVIGALQADEQRCEAETPLLLGVEFLHDAPQGQVYAVSEYQAALEAEGFVNVIRHSEYLITARKPG